jgi:L-threonylcarbamoyladenylate synthase
LRRSKAAVTYGGVSAKIVPADNLATIDEAAQLLLAGELVAFPTETVYGLGADATNDAAVARIFTVKGRPRFNPLIVHVAGSAAAERLAVFDARARLAARGFWPGPLTLVLPRRADCGLSRLVSAGLDTIALRVPVHGVGTDLLMYAGRPIAAPSANRSGRLSPTSAADVAAELGDQVALILDGGRCLHGIESTVLALTGPVPELLRAGAVTLEQLKEVLGRVDVAGEAQDRPRSPGRLASHYAPGLPVRLNVTSARPGEAVLAFGAEAPAGFAETLWLSRGGDLAEAAANLFAMLRRLDRPGFSGIAVMPIPEDGLGRAINDRLRRAAAPRDAG